MISTISTPSTIRFTSTPFERKAELLPIKIGLALGWIIGGLSLPIALWTLQNVQIWGGIMLLATACFCTFLGFATHHVMRNSYLRFSLSFNGPEMILLTNNEHEHTKSSQRVSLNDITSAEFYEPSASRTVYLRTSTRDVELPLWAFAPEEQKQILNYLHRKNLKIINAPLDGPELIV